ncbi:hypothetical protein ACKFKG_03765 [Phormidesmis sp. 146-35]
MTNSYHRALSLSCLARANSNFCSDAISAVQELEDENSKAEVLCHLCTHLPSAVLFQIESIIKTLKFLDNRLIVLAELIKQKPTQIQAVLTDLERVEDQARKAEILIKLVPHQPNLFLDALEVIKKVPEKYKHPALLIQLFQCCSLENLNIARKSIGGVSLRYEQEKIMLGAAHLLSDQEAIKLTLTVLGSSRTIDASRSELIQRLVRQKPATFELCFSLALKIEDKHEKLRILTVLSDYRSDKIAQTVSFARQIQDTSSKLKSLGRIGCLDSKIYVSTLKELAKTKDIKACCETLEILTETHPNLVHRLLKEVLGLQEGYEQADILVRIGQGKPENRLNVLQVVHKIHDITTRTKVLVNLVEHDEEIYFQAIENLDDIQIAHSRTEILEELGKINPKHWIEALDILDKMHERQEYNLKLPRMRRIAEKIPKTLFPRLLQSVERLSKPYNKAQVLCSAMKQDKELLSQVLELTGKIEEEFSYASIFIQVADQFPDFFQTALDATRKVSFEHNRAVNFTRLAIVTPIGQFSDLLAAVSEMTEGDSMAAFFHDAENYIPSRHLEEVLNIVEQIPINQLKAYALSAYLSRLLLSTHFDWNIHLRLLAHRDRANLMQDLATLYPAIAHLGGTAAIRGMVDAMREVCSQWK